MSISNSISVLANLEMSLTKFCSAQSYQVTFEIAFNESEVGVYEFKVVNLQVWNVFKVLRNRCKNTTFGVKLAPPV